MARLFNLPGQEHFVQDRIHLVKREYQVQFTDVLEKGVENLYKEMDRLEVRELIVVGVHADTEEETGVSSVDDLVVPELDKVGLVLLVSRRYESVYFAP